MRTSNRKTGQATVEMALVLPLFIFVIIGIFDFGRLLHSWSTLNYQCVRAARVATRRISPLIARNLFTADTHLKLGQEENVYGVWDEFWKYRSPTMPVEGYSFGENSFEGVGTGTRYVTISASYTMTLMTPLMGALVGGENGEGTITISASVTEQKE